MHYLQVNLDTLLCQHSCSQLIIVGDLNQHVMARSFDELLILHGLTNHVTFPPHTSGSSLNLVISDLPESVITCHGVGTVGSPDHFAIFAPLSGYQQTDETLMLNKWLWDRRDWDSMRDEMENIACTIVLQSRVMLTSK